MKTIEERAREFVEKLADQHNAEKKPIYSESETADFLAKGFAAFASSEIERREREIATELREIFKMQADDPHGTKDAVLFSLGFFVNKLERNAQGEQL